MFLRSTRVPPAIFSPRDFEGLAAMVLAAEKMFRPAELTLDLTNPRRIQQLNRRFRGVDRTTDVISFRNEGVPTHRSSLHGDIAISVQQAKIQAKKVGHPWKRELRLLWIHGMLHLLGYTDYEPEPRRRMFKRQNELLRRWERKAST